MTYLPTGCGTPDVPELDAFWAEAKKHVDLPDAYEVRWIGLDNDSTEQILELIAAGDKTGTFTLPWLIERTEQPQPRAGACIILVDFKGKPRMVVRLTEIIHVNFGDIEASHTAIDGTPVRDLEVWIPLHTRYWNALLAPHDLSVSPEMPVYVEPFEQLYPVAS